MQMNHQMYSFALPVSNTSAELTFRNQIKELANAFRTRIPYFLLHFHIPTYISHDFSAPFFLETHVNVCVSISKSLPFSRFSFPTKEMLLLTSMHC